MPDVNVTFCVSCIPKLNADSRSLKPVADKILKQFILWFFLMVISAKLNVNHFDSEFSIKILYCTHELTNELYKPLWQVVNTL